MRKITKFKRSIRAISPVVATLLMIAIAVIAALVVYAWVTGYIGNTTNKAGNAILIQSLTTDQDSNLVAYVQNVGQGDVVIDSGYVNGDLAAQSLSIALAKGDTTAVTTTYPVTSDDSLTIKIVATDGTFTQYTGSPDFENGQSTTYPVVFNLGTGGASMVPSGTHSYTAATLINVHTLPLSGYQFSSWTSTGSISFDSTTSASTTARISGAGTITANFVAVQPSQNYQVTFTLGQGGSSITPTGTQMYSGGSSVPVSAIPLSGYQFSSWTSTGTISFDSATSVSTIAHVNSAGSITANFIATQPTQNYQISWVLGAGGSSMNPTGTHNYAGGQIVTISATPSSGYQFSYWASSTNGFVSFGSVTSAITTAQISGTGSITANFIQIQTGQSYQVAFSTIGGGSSSSTNPTGTQTYAAGTIVPITATAGSGYQFSSWSTTGSISFGSSTSATTSALINGDGSIIANFITPQTGQNYQVTFTLGTGGTSMNPTGTQTYAGGSAVPVSAVAASGYQFSSWTSTGSISFDSATSSSTTAHVNSAGSITANFAPISIGQNYQVTFNTIGGGSSSSTNPTGTQTYAAGTIVPITATAGSGYQFSSWTSTGSISFDGATSASTNAHIGSDGTITANFAAANSVTYTITASAGSGGSISPSGAVIVNQGASQVFSITANTGYHIVDVVAGGISRGAVSSYTFTNVQANAAISATFAVNTVTYTITASAGSGGSISPSGAVIVNQGASQVFSITANTGYHIVDVVAGGISRGAVSSYTFTNVQANAAISATFAVNTVTYTITASAGSGGSISPSGAVIVNQGASQVFSITANTGYHIVDVVAGGISRGAVSSYTFTNVQANAAISATFAVNTVTYTITASAGSGGSISPSGAVIVNQGASQVFSIVPNSGYVVASLMVDGASAGFGHSYTFTNVIASHTITVTFIQGSTLISTGFDGNTWDDGWMAGGNPPWYGAAGQGIDGTRAAKSDPLGSNEGPFTSDAMNMQGATTIRITFMYKVLNTNSANDLRLAYCGRTTSGLPDLSPNSHDFTYVANIGRPAQDNGWYVGSLTLTSTTNPDAFRQYFFFRFESNLSINAGNLYETVWVDNVIITKSS